MPSEFNESEGVETSVEVPEEALDEESLELLEVAVDEESVDALEEAFDEESVDALEEAFDEESVEALVDAAAGAVGVTTAGAAGFAAGFQVLFPEDWEPVEEDCVLAGALSP